MVVGTTDRGGVVFSDLFALLDDPAIRGTLYWQWFLPDGVNGALTTSGLLTAIK